MESKNELMVFEQSGLGKLSIIKINDEDTFNLSDVCFGLGYTTESKGKLYLYKKRIEHKCETLDIKGLDVMSNLFTITKDIDFENTYITEDSFYDLCLESDAKNARKFRKWVTSEILPSLRKRGVYIMEHAKEEIVDKEKLFGKRRIKNTFANSEIHEVEKLYDDFLEYISEEYSAKDRIRMLQSVYNGLNELNLKLSYNAVKNIGKCYDVSLLQNKVLQDKAYLQNKRNGGIKSTLEIAKIMIICRSVAIKYLKQGAKLGWCNYDPKEAQKESGRINSKKNNKLVVQLSLNREYVSEFKSTTEAERQLGISHSSISQCCTNK